MRKNLSLLIIAFLTSTYTFSQVNVNTSGNYSNPTYLIDNALIGNGVVSSNHSFIGDPSQIGFFSDSLGLIGMDSGFVLSTGGVDSIGNTGVDTMFGYPQTYNLATDFFGLGDADLLTIANAVPAMIGQTFSVTSTQDVAILEFDFVPSSDTVRFNYVFASEEYLQFVNSQYNDVFAFFISGPGISGPYTSPTGFPNGAINIAEVPNSSPSLPITVSTVNDTTNSQYYNHDSLAQVSAFNGYTNVFTATAFVTACETYHIKLAIADGSDGTLDSGVLFEAGSFNAIEPGAPNAIISTTDVLCNGDSSGTASVCIQGGTAPYTINWNGVNPNALFAGSYTVVVTDNLGLSSTVSFTINEPTTLMATISQPILDLEANAIGGTPNFTYQWLFANVVVGTNATYTPGQNGNYILVITDINGCSDTSQAFSVTNVISGIGEYLSNHLLIYPNPFTEKTTIKLLHPNNKVFGIALFSPTGQRVKEFNASLSENTIIIERENLTKGVYILFIRTENYTSRNKLIIE